MRLCSCQDKHNIRRWFLQCFQQGIEGTCGKHMNLINNIYFIFTFCRAVRNLFSDLTYIIHTIVGCSIDLDHIHCSSCLDCLAHGTFITGAAIYGMLTVDCLRQNFGYCCFTGSSGTAEQIGMSDSVRFYLILQCCYNMLLPFDIRKVVRTELSV